MDLSDFLLDSRSPPLLGGLHYHSSTQSYQRGTNLATALEVCQWFSLSLHPGKCVGHSTVPVVLGFELGSVNQVAHHPQKKLLSLQNLSGC